MWLLVSTSNSDVRYPILGDHKYVVGRQNCDIVIPDASVSRKQSVLTMAHYETSVVKSYITPTLTLEDLSKFGTFVNKKAVKNPGGNTVTLKHNDEIRFGGAPESVFKAVYEPFVATTSCLEKAPKKSLLKVMCLLGGHLVRDWRPICDLLIMSKINVTIKVICAINNQKHIVTPQYLDDLYSHLMGRREKPDPVSYLPEVVDQEVPAGVSFHPDIRRMTLLKGLKFYFLSAVQFNKTNLAVSTAGGQPILLEDGTEEEAEAMTEDMTVVVAVSREVLATLSPSCQKFVRLVVSVLKRKNLRMVTDPEIGWAILTCNIVDFCNARSSITPDMLSYMAVQSMSQSADLDTSHSVRPANVKPEKRSIADVQNQNTSLIEDIKPDVKVIKTEMLSPVSKLQPMKTEPLEEQSVVEKMEATVSSAEVSQLKHKLSNKISTLPRTSVSAAVTSSHVQQIEESVRCDKEISGSVHQKEESVKHGNEISGSVPKGSQNAGFFNRNNHSGNNQRKPDEDDNPDEAVSVFARQQVKFRTKPLVNNFDGSDDDLTETSKEYSSKRKPVDLFGYDDAEVSLNKRRKTDQVEKNKQNRNADSDVFYLSTDKDDDNLSDARAAAMQNDPGDADSVSENNDTLQRGQGSNGTDSRGGYSHEVLRLPAPSCDGWLNMKTVKSSPNNESDTAQNGVADEDSKPDAELLRDSEGKLLRNLCQLEVTDLISRPTASKVISVPPRSKGQGQKNFKKFKKTQHMGAGRLPVIIGGRDLEVYTGSKHKDIEELFSACLAQENKRQEEERRDRDLFSWDDRTRKTSTKRIR